MAYKEKAPLPVTEGGTGAITLTAHEVLVGDGTSAISGLTVGTNGQVLVGSTGANPAFATLTSSSLTYTTGAGSLAINITAPVSIANGGTNATSMTNTDGVVYYNGTSLVTTAVGSATQVLTSNGSGMAPTFQNASGGSGITTIDGDTGSVTGSTVTITGASSGGTVEFSGSGTTLTFSMTDGSQNISLGSGTNISAGSYNTGLGYQSTTLNGSYNVSLGAYAASGLNGNSSVVIGYNSGAAEGIGSDISQSVVIGYGAGSAGSYGSEFSNTIAIGYNAGSQLSYGTTGSIYIGNSAGSSPSLTSSYDIFIGYQAAGGVGNATGNNIAIGYQVYSTGSGSDNIILGYQAGQGVSGSYNTILGYTAGSAYSGFAGESSNILIGANVAGVNSESNACHIGDGTGTGTGQLNKTFISGITGISVTGSAVLVNASNQLGVTVSSERFKENIKNLDSSKVLELQPKSFNYTVGNDKSPQTGLIAEEVYKIMPELVTLDQEGLPQSVKYHDLPVLLLLEIKKLRKELDELRDFTTKTFANQGRRF